VTARAAHRTNGHTDEQGAFFQSLGTNGRSCATCHVSDQAMSISPPQIRERYERTNGRDPLFAAVDGANCTNVKRTDRSGHSLLLKHGLIRIGINTGAPGLEPDALVAKAVAELDEPDLPVFLINGCPNPFNPGQPASFYTTDPGKALVTGLCSDLNRLKGPVLRGLAARAPYFHNGAAATLLDAVSFYNQRFQMNLTPKQKQQLVAFLNSL
jgi:cytochrome c peroxidase